MAEQSAQLHVTLNVRVNEATAERIESYAEALRRAVPGAHGLTRSDAIRSLIMLSLERWESGEGIDPLETVPPRRGFEPRRKSKPSPEPGEPGPGGDSIELDGGTLRFSRDVIEGGWIGALETESGTTTLRAGSPAELVGKANDEIAARKSDGIPTG
jgi:hypothetical protein